MSELIEKYDDVIKKIDENNKILEQLIENSEDVIKYLDLILENKDLDTKKATLFQDVQIKKYDSCAHILVYTKIEHDRVEGRTYKSCGCIKCGLDNSVLDCKKEYLDLNKKIMYDYLELRISKHLSFDGISGRKTEVFCNLELAQAIYAKIKKEHPNITDELAIMYFKIALDNIRNIKVSDARKASRAQRLALSKDFKSWNATDVHCQ